MPSELYDLDSAYGDYAALVSLNSAALRAGIRPVADVVVNHRCADQQDSSGVWNVFCDTVPHPGRRIAWGPWAITGDDPVYHGKGKNDTGEDFHPAADLDHTNQVPSSAHVGLLILCGLPGSGKTSLAITLQSLVDKEPLLRCTHVQFDGFLDKPSSCVTSFDPAQWKVRRVHLRIV